MIDHGRHRVLGVGIDAVDYDAAVARIMQAAREGRPLAASALAVHGVMCGALDAGHRYRLNQLDLVCPDGQPVRWALRLLHRVRLPERVYGPQLMLDVCRASMDEGLPIFLLGSDAGVLERLSENLRLRFPALRVAGVRPSRFRQLDDGEWKALVDEVRASGARIVFVGLGCPRQEIFAFEVRDALGLPTVAVGAAFDFHSGRSKQAPPLLQRWGLEWLFRLLQEPRRLWRRYLLLNPAYVCCWLLKKQDCTRFERTGSNLPSLVACTDEKLSRVSNTLSVSSMTQIAANVDAILPTAPPLSQNGDVATSALGVSVVVPLFNERECVDALIASLAGVRREFTDKLDLEFVLVDDGSSDGTAELLEAKLDALPGAIVIRHGSNRGIGAAIQTGIRSARHEIVVSMDSDGTYDARLIYELASRLTPGVAVVTASPYHVDGNVENVPLWRLRLSRLASQMYGAVCRQKLSCYTSCFRAYRRSAVAQLAVENEGFVGVAELLCRVIADGGRVVEYPARLRGRVAGHSKMRVLRASLGHLRLMTTILFQRWR